MSADIHIYGGGFFDYIILLNCFASSINNLAVRYDRVDSAPWFKFNECSPTPSKQPPVVSS